MRVEACGGVYRYDPRCYHTPMSSAKIAISLDPEALKQVDQLVERGLFRSRSGLIQDAVSEKLHRLRKVRLAQECAKLRPSEERAAVEDVFQSEVEWPEY